MFLLHVLQEVMPPRKRKNVPAEAPTITLEVLEDFSLPPFYSNAAPSDTCRALTLAAIILDGSVPPIFSTQMEVAAAVAEVREETLAAREQQLRSHEAAIEKIAAEHRLAFASQQAQLQTELDHLAEQRDEAEAKVKELIRDNDAIEERLSAFEEGPTILESDANHDAVRSHFESFGRHSADLLSALARHHDLIEKCNQSAVQLRAKVFTFYRCSKRVNMNTPWLNIPMKLPFEDAYEHAIGRPWNNLTTSKAELLERELGKSATQLCLKEDSDTCMVK